MKYFLIFSLFITLNAEAKVSLYDLIQSGRSGELGIKAECSEQIAKVPRESFQDPELKAWIKPLKEVAVSRHFFHYTNADIFLDIFETNETDRDYVQSLINLEKRFESIMLHSYNSKGINAAGMGFYLSANPFNSRRYGAIQLHLEVSENSKTLVDPWNAKAPVLLGRTLQKLGIVGCNQDEGVKSLYLQENGIDLAFYSYKEDWVVLLNEDTVTKTHIFSPLHSSSEVYKEMMKAEVKKYEFWWR